MKTAFLVLALALTGCVSLEDRAVARCNDVKRWQLMRAEGLITVQDYDNLIRAQGDLIQIERLTK